MRKRKTPERDWLYAHTAGIENGTAHCHPTPPGPISGPIEAHHEPNESLSDYRDERRWSDEITAWARGHSLLIEEDEE